MASRIQKPVIFLAFANDRANHDRYLRNLPEELRRVRSRLESIEEEGLCEVVVRTNVTANDLFDVFQDSKYRNRVAVFHFGGHAGAYQLLVESATGSPQMAYASGLADFLGQQSGLQLVFLNGCSTEPQVEGLLDGDVPAVIATSESIDDEMAMRLSERFYAGLAGGASVHTAYHEAVAAVKTVYGDQNAPAQHRNIDPNALIPVDRWPWELYVGEGSDIVKSWNIPEAAGDSLFGLPPLPKQALPEKPFLHLKWFEEKDAELFFGRGREIHALHEMVSSPDHAPVILFSGQTGVGKSSLLAAGVIPRLRDAFHVLYARCETDLDLLGSLAMGLRFHQPETATPTQIFDAWFEHEKRSGKPLLLVLDQLEEVFTNHSHEWVTESLKSFFRALDELFRDRGHRLKGKLILGFRKEWLPELESACKEARQHFTKFFLKRLGREGTIEAIEGVVRTKYLQRFYGLAIEPDLSTQIAEDLQEDQDSPLAPTLQILLTKMWDEACAEDPQEPRFTRALYYRLKQRGILLSDFLNEQLSALKAWHTEAYDSGLILDVLAQHTLSQMEMAATCTQDYLLDRYRHERDLIPALLQKCQELYLLVPLELKQEAGFQSATRLAHDTLAPLIRYLHRHSDLPGQRAIRVLENRAIDWAGDKVGAPLSEANLDIVEKGQQGMRAWTSDEERLVEASIVEREHVKKIRDDERRQKLELERRKDRAVVISVTLAFFMSIVAWFAYDKYLEADRANKELTIALDSVKTLFHQLAIANAELAEALDEADFQRLAALRARDSAREARDFAEYQRLIALRARDSAREARDFAEYQRLIALRARDSAREARDFAEYQRLIALRARDSAREARDFAERQRLIAVAERDTANLQRQRTLGLALANKSALLLASLDENERREGVLLAQRAHFYNDKGEGEFRKEIYDALRNALNEMTRARLAGRAKLQYTDCSGDPEIDFGGGGPVGMNPPHKDWVRAVAFSPNGRWVVSGGSEGVVYANAIRSVPSGSGDHFERRRDVIRDIRFDQQGEYLATVAEGGLLKLYRLEMNGNNCTDLGNDIFERGQYNVEGLVYEVAFYPSALEGEANRRLLAVAGQSQIDVLAASVSGAEIHMQKVHSVAARGKHSIRALTFSADGRWLIGGDQDGYVHVWSWPGLEPSGAPLKWAHKGEIRSIASSPTDRFIATGGVDTYIRLFELTEAGALVDYHLRSTLYGHAGPVNAVAFNQDGTQLASGSADQSVRLWFVDRVDVEAPIVMAEHSSWIEAVSFAHNGMLISGSADRTVKAWRTDIDKMADLICQRAQPNELSAEAWRRYVPAFDYEQTCSGNPFRTAEAVPALPNAQRGSAINE